MARIDVYFSLGSNLGDREAYLLRALEMMDAALGAPRVAVSDIIETPAWGFEGEAFLNLAVKYSLPRGRMTIEQWAEHLLLEIKRIERELGRTDTPEYDESGVRVYHSRTIDIDILFVGRHVIETENLSIPHPLISSREFVLRPLAQIATPSVRRAFPHIFQPK